MTCMNGQNPIEEIWRLRDELGAEEGYDVHRLFDRLRREQEKYADRLVRLVLNPKSETKPASVLREELPDER